MVKYGKIGWNMKTRIYLVRHGESVGNAKRALLGHTNLDLSELGVEQAKKCAKALSSLKLDAIYSSDLIRAYNTALPHAALRSMDVVPMQTLREIYMGDWEGAFVADLEGTELYELEWRKKFGTFKAPGGERVTDLADRIHNAVLELGKRHLGQTILIATHAAAIRSFYAKISGFKPEEWNDALPFPTNASYSVVEYENGRLIPCEYSSDKHFL